MFATSLQHYLVRAADLQASADFYEQVLGLSHGWRPDLPFPGFWMYIGEIPCVHLCSAQASAGRDYFIGSRPTEAHGSGAIDHIGLAARDRYAFVRHLERQNIPFRLRTAPGGAILQVFVDDPDGVRIEMNYETAVEHAIETERGRSFSPDVA